MATGDQNDFFSRLKARMPNGWFPLVSPILDAILQGIASAFVPVYAAWSYLVAQARLQTSTDGWLDISAVDFFGENGLPRDAAEGDASYLTRIQTNIIRERGTRQAVIGIVTSLTGTAPTIIEPMRPEDTGGYGFACGYSMGGAYGSMLMAYQAFVTAYRPLTQGVPYVNGYGNFAGGYSEPSRSSYVDVANASGGVTDAQIYAAIASVMPAGTVAWVSILSARAPYPSQAILDDSFILDKSSLL